MSASPAGLPQRYLRTPEAARFRGPLDPHPRKAPHLWHRAALFEARRPRRLSPRRLAGLGRARRQGVDLRPRRRHGLARQSAILSSFLRRRSRVADSARSCRRGASYESERDQLDLFRALPGDLAPRDAQDLMAYPFFSLAKSAPDHADRLPRDEIAIRVEAVPEHGMATIWDADVLIWAASQIVEARDAGWRTSRLMAATPYEILTFTGRGTSRVATITA